MSSLRRFADDCVLFTSGLFDLARRPHQLRTVGSRLAKKFNVAKCHSMRVTRHQHQHHKRILFDYSPYTTKLWKKFSRQNTLVSPSLITEIGVSTSQKYLPKQPRHLVSFAVTWLMHLGVLRKLHTKLWFGLNLSLQHPFGAHTRNFRLIRFRNVLKSSEDSSPLDLQEMAKRE